MKIFCTVLLDGDHERTFDIACGSGQKTFKWLGLVAAQRFALAAPVGALRHRDEYRGLTDRAQHLPSEIVLANGELPHPSALLSDFLLDGDQVTIYLTCDQRINPTTSSVPRHSKWASLAFTTSPDAMKYLDGDDEEEEDGYEEEGTENDGEIDESERAERSLRAAQALELKITGDAKFMRLVLQSQMLDINAMNRHLNTQWKYVVQALPNMDDDKKDSLKEIFRTHWATLIEIFDLFKSTDISTPSSTIMSVDKFESFLSDAGIFSARDVPVLGPRIYQRAFKAWSNVAAKAFDDNGGGGGSGSSDGLGLGGFLLSLILCAQNRHNDTFEKNSASATRQCHEALSTIFVENILPLVERLESPGYLKSLFASDTFLHSIRHSHNELFLVFNKFALRKRELPTSLPIESMTELLFEAQLQEEGAIEKTKALHNDIRKGPLIGRQLAPGSDYEAPPEDEFTFAEFVEAVARAGFYRWKTNLRTRYVPPAPVLPSPKGKKQSVANVQVQEEDVTELQSMSKGIAFVLKTLVEAPKDTQQQSRARK